MDIFIQQEIYPEVLNQLIDMSDKVCKKFYLPELSSLHIKNLEQENALGKYQMWRYLSSPIGYHYDICIDSHACFNMGHSYIYTNMAHELAHHLCSIRNINTPIEPHGREWKNAFWEIYRMSSLCHLLDYHNNVNRY